MLPNPYSASINGTNFRLIEETKGDKILHYLVGKVNVNTIYLPENITTSDSELRVPLTFIAYQALKDGLERVEGSRIDVSSSLEIKFIAP